MKTKNKHKLAAIVLAAGKGVRMRSDLPKVMHTLAGQPLIEHVLAALKPLAPEKTVLVVAPHMDSVREAAKPYDCAFAEQDKQLGTGHAVKCAGKALKGFKGTVLVVYGDTPLIRTEALKELLAEMEKHKAAIALHGMFLQDPTGYGRLVMRREPYVECIVECKDATAQEKKIPWVWGGIMAFDAEFLIKALEKLQPSPVTKEYYLTALIDMATSQKLRTLMVPVSEEDCTGINDRAQLAHAEFLLQQRLRQQAMREGATLVDPQTVYFCADTVLGRDVVVQPHVMFGPGVTVADGVEIHSFSHIEGAKVGKGAIIGPFARLRPGSVIGEHAHVGNFVELKKTTLGKGAKANHLSYVGDTKVGEGANIGAGTITCNYDGVNKYDTTIGAGAFIGSNTSLVAPVTVGAGAVIGAGSVITENVEADALAIARGRQVNKAGRGKKTKKK